jgi:NAD/NADP transhydrogenase alpha subunit
MKIGVPKETDAGERRVALVPEAVKKLVAQDLEVLVQRGAGDGALIPDSLYEDAGARLAEESAVWDADVIVKVAPPSAEETTRLGPESVLIGFLAPLSNGEGVRAIAGSGATSFALEAVPRMRSRWTRCPRSPTWPVIGPRCWVLRRWGASIRC